MLAMLSHWHFAHPVWLYVLPVCIAVLAYIIWQWPYALADPSSLLLALSRRTYRHPQYSALASLQSAERRKHAVYHWRNLFISYGVLLCLIFVALAQPFRQGKKLPVMEHHRDIVFIVDTSLDMILRDYEVDGRRIQRMTMLKDVLRHFIEALHGNRIGLIVFSEQPYYYVPLTSDYSLLQYQIQRLQPAELTGRSTDISRALLFSLKQFETTNNKKTGVRPELVLITDANRSARHIDPRAVAKLISEHHLRLNTIAIGAGSYAAQDENQLSLVYHPASFYLLQGIAEAGDGKFFWAKNRDSLQKALEVINQAEIRTSKSTPQFLRKPFYMWPLLLALIWLTMWQLAAILRWRT